MSQFEQFNSHMSLWCWLGAGGTDQAFLVSIWHFREQKRTVCCNGVGGSLHGRCIYYLNAVYLLPFVYHTLCIYIAFNQIMDWYDDWARQQTPMTTKYQ
jgi:hypothetical protein